MVGGVVYICVLKKPILRLILTILLITPFLYSHGQIAFYKYKKVTDQLINKNFDSTLIHLIKCKNFNLFSADGNVTTSFPSYEKFKLEKEKFSQITFTYIFISPTLNNPFSFTITLDSKKRPVYKKTLFENVPVCVRLNKKCDFISKDSAIRIALKDSIEYVENLSITLQQAPQTNVFYWVVEGQPKQKPQKKVKYPYSSGYRSIDYRYINATTSEIISMQQFFEKASVH
jgi:hypothetical protein